MHRLGQAAKQAVHPQHSALSSVLKYMDQSFNACSRKVCAFRRSVSSTAFTGA